MRRASKKFWLLVSGLALAGLAIQAAPGPTDSKRTNELTLAGLRPGRDKILIPQKAFRDLERDESVKDALVWGDICTHRELRVELDADHVVRTVSVNTNYKLEIMAKCAESSMAPGRLKLLATGQGLQLGDSCDRVTPIYGAPESKSPSVQGNEQLELLLYSFDWVGPNVPQVMEVGCSASSRKVAAIMLAASSL